MKKQSSAPLSPAEALDEIRRLLDREYRIRARGGHDVRRGSERAWGEYWTVANIRREVRRLLKRVAAYADPHRGPV